MSSSSCAVINVISGSPFFRISSSQEVTGISLTVPTDTGLYKLNSLSQNEAIVESPVFVPNICTEQSQEIQYHIQGGSQVCYKVSSNFLLSSPINLDVYTVSQSSGQSARRAKSSQIQSSHYDQLQIYNNEIPDQSTQYVIMQPEQELTQFRLPNPVDGIVASSVEGTLSYKPTEKSQNLAFLSVGKYTINFDTSAEADTYSVEVYPITEDGVSSQSQKVTEKEYTSEVGALIILTNNDPGQQFNVGFTASENPEGLQNFVGIIGDDNKIQKDDGQFSINSGNPEEPDDDDPLSGGAIAAIVIAVIVVVAVAAFVVYWFLFRKKDNLEDAENAENEDEMQV